jgi:hypothetical protein
MLEDLMKFWTHLTPFHLKIAVWYYDLVWDELDVQLQLSDTKLVLMSRQMLPKMLDPLSRQYLSWRHWLYIRAHTASRRSRCPGSHQQAA